VGDRLTTPTTGDHDTPNLDVPKGDTPPVGISGADGTNGDHALGGRERYLAVRVLNALLREDYGGLAGRVTHGKAGVALALPGGRRVRLVPGALFQDFSVAHEESLTMDEVLATLRAVADPADEPGVRAFVGECAEALRALELHDARRDEVLGRVRELPAPIRYEALAAFVDHPVYPTARSRTGLSDTDLPAYAAEFAPVFELCWAAVPRHQVTWSRPPDRPHLHGDRYVCARPLAESWWPTMEDVGLPGSLSAGHVLFPVHPLAVPVVRRIPGVVVAPRAQVAVRPTLSMRTVAPEVSPRTHLKLPLTTSTLGRRNRRSIKPSTLADGARAESLLREVAAREPDLPMALADEQTYAHAGHEYLGWMIRRYPAGEVVPVAALLAPSVRGGRVIEELAARHRGGDVERLLGDYLDVLFRWNVRLFVRYGVALEAHQQNLSLVFGDGRLGLLIKDNDGLLAAPDRLRAAGLGVPDFSDPRMYTDDPHSLADVFVTITLHLAAAAIVFGALAADDAATGTPGGGPGVVGTAGMSPVHVAGGEAGERAARLLRKALSAALDEHGEDPMARLLRARTLDAARLVGKSMVTAGTLVDKARTGALDVNKFYGTSGPNYLRRPTRRATDPTTARPEAAYPPTARPGSDGTGAEQPAVPP
jgi:hypothetical protein